MSRQRRRAPRRQEARRQKGPSIPAILAVVALVAVAVGGTYLAFASRLSPLPTSGFAGGNDTPAPDFTLAAVDGRALSLAEYRDRKNVLLYFNMGVG